MVNKAENAVQNLCTSTNPCETSVEETKETECNLILWTRCSLLNKDQQLTKIRFIEFAFLQPF